jgi:hypothetical protein
MAVSERRPLPRCASIQGARGLVGLRTSAPGAAATDVGLHSSLSLTACMADSAGRELWLLAPFHVDLSSHDERVFLLQEPCHGFSP